MNAIYFDFKAPLASIRTKYDTLHRFDTKSIREALKSISDNGYSNKRMQ